MPVKDKIGVIKTRKGVRAKFVPRPAEDPKVIEARWKKKKDQIHQLANDISRMRLNVSKDMASDNERTSLIATIVALIDKIGERPGNKYSVIEGKYGVTYFKKKHLKLSGKEVDLNYVGKAGVPHHHIFKSEKISKALAKAVKNSPTRYIFQTSDGLKISEDMVNEYLDEFGITAKVIRAFFLNHAVSEKLRSLDIPEKEKDRKKLFNTTVKKFAEYVGHGSGTCKKHYIVPELPEQYITHGKIIDLKSQKYYKAGGKIPDNKNTFPVSVSLKPIKSDYSISELTELFKSFDIPYKIKKYLGKGSFGKAYESEDGRVIKITNNGDEAFASAVIKIMGNDLKRQAKVYNVHKITDGKNNLYIIEKEKVEVLSDVLRDIIGDDVEGIDRYFMDDFRLKFLDTEDQESVNNALERIYNHIIKYLQHGGYELDADGKKKIKDVVRRQFEFMRQLQDDQKASGLDMADSHNMNIGFSGNKLVCFDCVSGKTGKTYERGGIPNRYKEMGFTSVGQKKKSIRPEKKWMVLAKKGDKYRVVHGGQKGMEDFSQHHDKERQKRFWNRMGGFDSEKSKDPFSPLYWHKKFGTWEEGGPIEGGENLSNNDDFANSEKSRKFIPTKITKNELQSIISGTSKTTNGDTIQAALIYIRGEASASPINKRAEPEFEKERLAEFIDANNLWYSRELNDNKYVDRGGEHIVYEDPSNKDFVLKTNNLTNYYSWSDYLINLLLNNTFFPATSYELIGFKKNEHDDILPVVRQYFVTEAIIANLKEVQKYLFTQGFRKIHPLSNAYRHYDLGVMIGDLHDRNVLVQDDTLFFIDTKFFLLLDTDYVYDNGGNIDDFASSEKLSNFVVNPTKYEVQSIISGKSRAGKETAIQAAANYLRGSQGTSPVAKGSKRYKEQEAERLRHYISANNLWITDLDLTSFIDEGCEQKVYLFGKESVVKVNDSIFFSTWEDYFNNLLLHNYFFPDTTYELIGFTEDDGRLFAVVKQPFIKANQKTDLNQVKKFMSDNGFENTKEENYENKELGIILEDLHGENVLTKDGVLYFIDTVFYVKEDLGARNADGGKVANDKGKLKFKKMSDNLFVITSDTQEKLAKLFIRLNSYLDCWEFKGKIFTLEEFKNWYIKEKGAFTYYQDYKGFNIPDRVIDVFLSGSFDPLSEEEKWLMDNLKSSTLQKPYYIIGYVNVPGEEETRHHELAHALYYLSPAYKAEVNEIIDRFWKGITTRSLIRIREFLTKLQYDKSIWNDEMNAYLVADKDYLIEKNAWSNEFERYRRILSNIFQKNYFEVFGKEFKNSLDATRAVGGTLIGKGQLIIAKYYDKLIDAIETVKEELADTGPSKESMLKDLLFGLQEKLDTIIMHVPDLLHHAQTLRLVHMEKGGVVDIEDINKLQAETKDLSDDEVTELYPIFFDGKEIAKNKITPDLRKQLAKHIFESTKKLDIVEDIAKEGEIKLAAGGHIPQSARQQIDEYIKEGIFITKDDKPVVGILPISRFKGPDADIHPNQLYVDRKGVNKWKKRIKAGERPHVLIGFNEHHGENRIKDAHHRLEAYDQLGIDMIPVIDVNGKILGLHKITKLGRRSQPSIKKWISPDKENENISKTKQKEILAAGGIKYREAILKKQQYLSGGPIRFTDNIDDAEYDFILNIKDIQPQTHYFLEDVIKHDKLFEIYPEFRKIIVIFEDIINEIENARSKVKLSPFGPYIITIGIHLSFYKTHGYEKHTLTGEFPEFSKEGAMLHELQHVLQYRTGRTTGKSINMAIATACRENSCRDVQDATARNLRVKVLIQGYVSYLYQNPEQEARWAVDQWLKKKGFVYGAQKHLLYKNPYFFNLLKEGRDITLPPTTVGIQELTNLEIDNIFPQYLISTMEILFPFKPFVIKTWETKFDINNSDKKPFNLILPHSFISQEFINKFNNSQSLAKTNYNIYTIEIPIDEYVQLKEINTQRLIPLDFIDPFKQGGIIKQRELLTKNNEKSKNEILFQKEVGRNKHTPNDRAIIEINRRTSYNRFENPTGKGFENTIDNKYAIGGSISKIKQREAEAKAKEILSKLSEEDFKSLKDQFNEVVSDILVGHEKKLNGLLANKTILQREIDSLYEQEKGLEFGDAKRALTDQRRALNNKVNALELEIRHQQNIVKVISNGGELATFTDKKGTEHNEIPYFVRIKTDMISFDEDTILTDEVPPYIPFIDEKIFADKGYVFDAIRIAPDQYILAVNGYNEQKGGTTTYIEKEPIAAYHPSASEQGYVIVSLDQLALINDYYFTKAKAAIRKKAQERDLETEKRYDALSEERRASFLNQKGYYHSLPAAVKKKITKEEYEALDLAGKEKLYKPFGRAPVKRLTSKLEDNSMWASFHQMYERFLNPLAVPIKKDGTPIKPGESRNPYTIFGNKETFAYWYEFRDMMKWKMKDIQVQRETDSEVRKIALETSFGESNTNDSLKQEYGILVKRQNGTKILPPEINQIKEAWIKTEKTFGTLSHNAKKDNLKISHTGIKLVFASKAAGVFIPDMKTIAVSNKFGNDQFEQILAHEVGHWIDYGIGHLKGKRYACDDFESTAGIIAGTFRKNMNQASDSNYINATKECFARAMEQYFAFENFGEEATLIYSSSKVDEIRTYHSDKDYVSKEKFNNVIKPLIKQFLSEQESFFKYSVEVESPGTMSSGGQIQNSIEDKLKQLGFTYSTHSFRFHKQVNPNKQISAFYNKNKNLYSIRGSIKFDTVLGGNSIGISFDYNNEKDFWNKINELLQENNMAEGGKIYSPLQFKEKIEKETGLKVSMKKGALGSSMRGYIMFTPIKRGDRYPTFDFKYARSLKEQMPGTDAYPNFFSVDQFSVYYGNEIYNEIFGDGGSIKRRELESMQL